MRLVSVEEMSRIEAHLSGLLDRAFGGEQVPELTEALRAYVLAGGKRVRPQLTWWTYRRCVEGGEVGGGVGGRGAGAADAAAPDREALDRAVLDLACAWELFHAFLLAHDDIIDKGDMRRSQPALHKRLAQLDSGSEVFGVNLAIVGGDLLFTAALSLLHELELPGDRYREVLKLFSRVAAITGFGQAIDIVQGHVPMDEVREAELLREYHWKTAAYTFEGPMLSGAIAAGAGAGARAAISRFALSLGQAYQLQNDLIDLAVPAHEGCDLVQGKRTITLVRARSAMGPAGRAELDRRMGRITLGGAAGVAEAETLRQELLSNGAATRTGELVAELLGSAEAAAGDEALPTAMRDGLREVLGGMKRAYFV